MASESGAGASVKMGSQAQRMVMNSFSNSLATANLVGESNPLNNNDLSHYSHQTSESQQLPNISAKSSTTGGLSKKKIIL